MQTRLLLTAALSLTMSAFTAIAAVPTYTLTDLGFLPGFTNMYPSAINIHGDVVGYADIRSGLPATEEHVFLYGNGKLSDLNPNSFTYSFAIDINARQQLIGLFVDQGDPLAFTVWNGQYQQFNLVIGLTSPTAINDIGQIVGNATGYDIISNQYSAYAFLRQPNYTVIQLPTFNGSIIHPAAINNLGQIAGSVQYNNANGFLLSDVVISQPGGKAFRDLGNLGGPAYATGMNIWGQVVGYSATTIGSDPATFYAALYSHGRVINLGLPASETVSKFQSFATGINDFGVIVGYSELVGVSAEAKPSAYARGLVYINGQWRVLNDLVNATGKGLTIVKANGINDFGQIVATALDAAGNVHAVILTVVGRNRP
jgi:probable HAF family extracellular repeat protein